MDDSPDINETLRSEGPEAARARTDRAARYNGDGGPAALSPTEQRPRLRAADRPDANDTLRSEGPEGVRAAPPALTEITLFSKTDGILSKRISLAPDGSLKSDASECLMARGTAKRATVAGVAELGRIIGSLPSNKAIALGAMRPGLPDEVQVVTKSKLNGATNVIARTADFITAPAGRAGLVLLDFDAKGMPDKVAARIKELGGFWPALASVLPALRNAARVVRSSTSAGIYRTDTGERMPGSDGQHVYVAAADGADAERFLQALHDRCWLAGLGWQMPNRAGQRLDRSIVDRMVGRPERLVFEGAPIVQPPLEQDAESRRPAVFEGETLDTAAVCPPLSDEEKKRLAGLKADDAKRIKPECVKRKAAFVAEHAARYVSRGMSPAVAARMAERICEGVLLSGEVLPFDDPDFAGKTVADVLADRERFVDATMADPIEGIDYGPCKAMVMRRANGEVWINSFAHGSTVYELRGSEPEPGSLPVVDVSDDQLASIATVAEKILLDAGVGLYQRAGTLVRPIVAEVDAAYGRRTRVAQLLSVDHVYLRDLLSRCAIWRKIDKRTRKSMPTKPPPETAVTILGRVGEWKFPAIAGVISTPTMRPDGTILDRPGYDEITRLLLVEPPPMPAVPAEPTREDALAALKLLSDLLGEFPMDKVSRSVALSAMITAVVRGAFPVAPMHAARAPVAASGKSYLFDLVAAIAIGQRMPVIAAGRNEEETEKRLGSALLAGQPLLSIDNVSGELGGDALCQIIERPSVMIRILGKSQLIQFEARMSLCCTGNNIILAGDLCRRTLTAALDPKLENPEFREFKNNPLDAVLANRGIYIAAALTVCRGYIAAGRPNTARRLASFEGWSDTVRSALIWLGEADPVASMESARAEDPERGALREVLAAWGDAIGVGYEYRSTLRNVLARIGEMVPDADGRGYVPRWPELVELAAAIRGVVGRPDPDAGELGRWLRKRKDRVIDGRSLASELNRKGIAEWWVVDETKKRKESDELF